ncbi:MAG: SUMF1/EgtB/PvdO family nonheme iron enzyme [Crocinitomicaceae bacterium]|nr:SUMF1/EgtB/PvdO family nonheme iron enzyme [Crocinitomicaceae bacterium]
MSITGQNTTSQFSLVEFDLSWDNSWRTSTLESNWDAAWVFVKIRNVNSNIWQHAKLNNTGHTAPAGAVIDPGLVNVNAPFDASSNYAAGVFIYRDADGHGSVNYNEVQLRWNYGANGLQDNDSVQVCVYAIEMVYAPEGSFFVGDAEASTTNRFVEAGTPNPFEITSENQIAMSASSGLWTSSGSGITAVPLPNEFPKGFQAFYAMKYEISQGMYKEFLNKLTRSQQYTNTSIFRFRSITVNNYMHSGATQTTPANRNGIRLIDDPGGASPRVYACDLNNNGVFDEPDDGEFLACNWLNYGDVVAFADWTGLRPMTELEYEKLSRGTLSPVSGELAWGNNTDVNQASTIVNARQFNELPGNTPSNFCGLNQASVNGPMRVGTFAVGALNRVDAGGGYFGAMELSGNVAEFYISVNRATTSVAINNTLFQGQIHGDGELAVNGDQNQGWPTSSFSIRGGDWSITDVTEFAISARNLIAQYTSVAARNNSYGGRLGRTAP